MLERQYFDHLLWTASSLEKTWCWERLRARGEGWQRMRWLGGIINSWVWANSGDVKDGECWRAAVHGVAKSRTGLSDWTTTIHWLILDFQKCVGAETGWGTNMGRLGWFLARLHVRQHRLLSQKLIGYILPGASSIFRKFVRIKTLHFNQNDCSRARGSLLASVRTLESCFSFSLLSEVLIPSHMMCQDPVPSLGFPRIR